MPEMALTTCPSVDVCDFFYSFSVLSSLTEKGHPAHQAELGCPEKKHIQEERYDSVCS